MVTVFGGSQGAESINKCFIDIINNKLNSDYQIIWAVGQKKYEEVGEVRDLPGNIFEWLGRNYDKNTPEQREKIFMDLEKKQE